MKAELRRLGRWLRRRRVPIAFVLLTVISTGSAYLSYHAGQRVSDANRRQTVAAAKQAKDLAATKAREGQQQAQRSAVDACHQRADGRADLFTALTALVQAVIPPPQNAAEQARDRAFIRLVAPSIDQYAHPIHCVLPIGVLDLPVHHGRGVHVPPLRQAP